MRGKALRLIVIGQRSNLEEYESIWSDSEDTYHEAISLPLIIRIKVVATWCVETKLVVDCEVEWLVGDRKQIIGRWSSETVLHRLRHIQFSQTEDKGLVVLRSQIVERVRVHTFIAQI